jgi:YfiH family protein
MSREWIPADWAAPSGVTAGTTTRCGPGSSRAPYDRSNLGAAVGDDPLAVRDNRERLIGELGLPRSPLWLQQVHGTGVLRATGDLLRRTRDTVPTADAAVAREPGVVLAIQTADCLPLLLAADDGSEIGAAHAGWRGLAAGVIEATLAQMGTPRERLHAWLGPAIGPDAYEVGSEVREAFVRDHPEAAAAFRAARPGHWLCDLYALARQRLVAQGVTRLAGGTHCTFRERELFYSYRRDGATGRMATLIWIAPGP